MSREAIPELFSDPATLKRKIAGKAGLYTDNVLKLGEASWAIVAREDIHGPFSAPTNVSCWLTFQEKGRKRVFNPESI